MEEEVEDGDTVACRMDNVVFYYRGDRVGWGRMVDGDLSDED